MGYEFDFGREEARRQELYRLEVEMEGEEEGEGEGEGG